MLLSIPENYRNASMQAHMNDGKSNKARALQPSIGRTRRLFAVFVAMGLLCWGAGAFQSSIGHGYAGVVLRNSGLLLLLGTVLRRSTLLSWTFVAILIGTEIGIDFPRIAAQAHFPGDLFLRLIRMVVAPLILASIPAGIAGHSQLRSVGRVALKAFIYFEVVTTIGLLIGTIAESISGAGWGVAIPAIIQASLPASQAAHGWQQAILELFPENIARSVVNDKIIQVVVFSILLGCALAKLPEGKRAPLVAIFQSLADTMFQMVRLFMFLVPFVAGSAMAYTVGSMGLAALIPLGKLVVTCYAAMTFFCVAVLLPTLLLFRIPVRGFLEAVAEPAAIGFATTTSEAALPLAMERMEKFGVPRWIVSFILPTGYSFNLTGSSIYLSAAAIFAAQAAGIHLTFAQYVEMLAVLVLASKGLAGIPRAAVVILLATASAIHIPTAPILLILGIDTIMDMGRTALNVAGNCMASVVIARTENVAFAQES
jgi:proton glutamate symport protein